MDDSSRALAQKGQRRTVVLHAVLASGAADFETAPGRDEYGDGDEGALLHEQAFNEYVDVNFDDAGAEVRSLDQRCTTRFTNANTGHASSEHGTHASRACSHFPCLPMCAGQNFALIHCRRLLRADEEEGQLVPALALTWPCMRGSTPAGTFAEPGKFSERSRVITMYSNKSIAAW